MAEALGWPNKPLGLSDIIALNNDPQGWGSVGHPEWGKFKYAHTNPEVSSTGLSMVAMEFYAGADKVRGLTEADINQAAVKDYVKNIENSIVHYSATTTIFKDNVRKGGMDYISAVALEEVDADRAEQDAICRCRWSASTRRKAPSTTITRSSSSTATGSATTSARRRRCSRTSCCSPTTRRTR